MLKNDGVLFVLSSSVSPPVPCQRNFALVQVGPNGAGKTTVSDWQQQQQLWSLMLDAYCEGGGNIFLY